MPPAANFSLWQRYAPKLPMAPGGTLAEARNISIYNNHEKGKHMKDTYMTVSEVAEMLKISYDKALEFVKYSGIEYVQIGRQYRVLESKLNAFLYPPKKVKQPLRRRPIYQIVERKE